MLEPFRIPYLGLRTMAGHNQGNFEQGDSRGRL